MIGKAERWSLQRSANFDGWRNQMRYELLKAMLCSARLRQAARAVGRVLTGLLDRQTPTSSRSRRGAARQCIRNAWASDVCGVGGGCRCAYGPSEATHRRIATRRRLEAVLADTYQPTSRSIDPPASPHGCIHFPTRRCRQDS